MSKSKTIKTTKKLNTTYIENLLRDAVKYKLAIWRALGQVERELDGEVEMLEDLIDSVAVCCDDPAELDAAELLGHVIERLEQGA